MARVARPIIHLGHSRTPRDRPHLLPRWPLPLRPHLLRSHLHRRHLYSQWKHPGGLRRPDHPSHHLSPMPVPVSDELGMRSARPVCSHRVLAPRWMRIRGLSRLWSRPEADS